jgi:hypothetical protein
MVSGHWVRHWFLYVPEAPGPLLGRDLLSKLGTTVSMDLGPPDIVGVRESYSFERQRVTRECNQQSRVYWAGKPGSSSHTDTQI